MRKCRMIFFVVFSVEKIVYYMYFQNSFKIALSLFFKKALKMVNLEKKSANCVLDALQSEFFSSFSNNIYFIKNI